MDLSTNTPGSAQSQGLGRLAMRGSVLNSAQWLINKALTAGAMLVVAFFLTPAEYGVGVQALAIFSVHFSNFHVSNSIQIFPIP